MDTKRVYKNPNMEKRRQELLKKEQASFLLISNKNRYVHKPERIDLAFEKSKEYIANGKIPHREDKLVNLFIPLGKSNSAYLLRLLKTVEKETDFFEDEKYCWKFLNGCMIMAYWGDFWVREPEVWKNKTHNVEKQFTSLLHYLFAKYPVPSFMNEAFLSNDGMGSKKQEWFLHMGSGQNIRTAHGLPYPMTRMMAHLFSEAPSDFKIMEAFRFAHIRSLDGSMPIIKGWLESPLAIDFSNMDFWDSVVRFFIDNPMLDPSKISSIIDYIYNQKYVDTLLVTPDGTRINRGPAQPNFTMKGRNPEALLTQVEKWHTHTAISKKNSFLQWKSCGIPGGRIEEGSEKGRKVYSIVELLNSTELKEEGKTMHHCVATYASSCSSGRNDVYSVAQVEGNECGRKATISLNLSGKPTLQEARGKYNETLSVPVARIIRTWANLRNVAISNWAKL